jgi:hypothetical protein
MGALLPITHLCLEYAVRRRLTAQRPGVSAMAELAARELLEADPLRFRHASRSWLYIYWLTIQSKNLSVCVKHSSILPSRSFSKTAPDGQPGEPGDFEALCRL